jgi:hypothetical protein
MVNLLAPGGSAPVTSSGTTGGQNASLGTLFSNPDRRQQFFDALGALGAGLTTGNSWQQQLGNANLGLTQLTEAKKQKTQADLLKNQTYSALLNKAPELAQAIQIGAMTPTEAYVQYIKQQQEAAKAAKPNWQMQNIDGKLVRVDLNSGQQSLIGDYSDPQAKAPAAAKENQYWMTHPDEYTAYQQRQIELQKAKNTPTELVRNLEAAGLKQGTPEFQQALMQAMKKPGMSLETDAEGNIRFVQGDAQSMPKLTVEQGKNAGFLLRAKSAEDVISKVGKEGTSVYNKTAQSLPLGVGNFAVGEDAQKYEQAQRDFVNAVLRQESGAVISPEEFDNAKRQYFPQPGDGPQVIEQKRLNRENAIEGFKLRAGPGAVNDPSAVHDAADYFK